MTPNESPAALLHVTNAKLCDFATRWTLDGDYLRCCECSRPQLASYAHLAFPHAAGCCNANADPHPWIVLAELLVPITTAPGASESRGSVPNGWRKHELLDIARFLCRPYSLGSTRIAICEVVKGFGEEIRRIAKGMSSAHTPPAVSNGEPTAEQWMTAIRVWYYSQHHGMGCDPTAEWIAAYARSAAAKGEG